MLAATGKISAWLDANTAVFSEALANRDIERIMGLSENRGTPKKVCHSWSSRALVPHPKHALTPSEPCFHPNKAMLNAACMTGGDNGKDVALALLKVKLCLCVRFLNSSIPAPVPCLSLLLTTSAQRPCPPLFHIAGAEWKLRHQRQKRQRLHCTHVDMYQRGRGHDAGAGGGGGGSRRE